MKNLQKSFQNILPLTQNNDFFEISVYKDQLTTPEIIQSTIRLKKAFPTLSKEFFDIFSERIKENNFTDNRLKDSINHVIDNCIYPQPTIAQFITYDKKVKLYNHNDIVKMLSDNPDSFKSYRPVKVNKLSRPMYAHINDIEMYGLELWNA